MTAWFRPIDRINFDLERGYSYAFTILSNPCPEFCFEKTASYSAVFVTKGTKSTSGQESSAPFWGRGKM